MAKTPWRIVADETGSCNCAWGCPCQFNALPTYGRCEALVGVRIREGHYGDTSLAGVTFAVAYWWPGPVHEGNGIAQYVIDEMASPAQRTAIRNIASGKEGGTFFEIFASMCSQVLETLYVPIELVSDTDKRTASMTVRGFGEFRIEPIRNPVTGEEHRARIQLPNGFEYKVAEMGNCVEHRARFGGKTLHNTNCYAQFASVDWSNA